MTAKISPPDHAAERLATTNRAAFADFWATVRGETGHDSALQDFAGWQAGLPQTLIDAIPHGPRPALVLRIGGTRRVWSHDDLHAGGSPLDAALRARLDDPLQLAARYLLDDDLRPDDRVLAFHTHDPALLLSGATLILHDAQDAAAVADLALEESATRVCSAA